MKYYQWYEAMKSRNHANQGTVVRNKIQPFIMAKIPMKYGKLYGTKTSDSKIWDLK